MRQEKALLAEKSLPHPEMEDVNVKLQIKLNLMTLCPEEEQTLCTVFISEDKTACRRNRLPGRTRQGFGRKLGSTYNEKILEQIIEVIDNKKLIKKAISKAWDLTVIDIEI